MPYKDREKQKECGRRFYANHKTKFSNYQKNRKTIRGMPKQEYHRFWYMEHREQRNQYNKSRRKSEARKLSHKLYRLRNPGKILKWKQAEFRRLGYTLQLNPNVVMGLLNAWSKAIRHRDQNKCVICGLPSEHAHHILPKARYPTLALNLNNGISLCIEHHNEVHGKCLV